MLMRNTTLDNISANWDGFKRSAFKRPINE